MCASERSIQAAGLTLLHRVSVRGRTSSIKSSPYVPNYFTTIVKNILSRIKKKT
jgi:hypothetical protein